MPIVKPEPRKQNTKTSRDRGIKSFKYHQTMHITNNTDNKVWMSGMSVWVTCYFLRSAGERSEARVRAVSYQQWHIAVSLQRLDPLTPSPAHSNQTQIFKEILAIWKLKFKNKWSATKVRFLLSVFNLKLVPGSVGVGDEISRRPLSASHGMRLMQT